MSTRDIMGRVSVARAAPGAPSVDRKHCLEPLSLFVGSDPNGWHLSAIAGQRQTQSSFLNLSVNLIHSTPLALQLSAINFVLLPYRQFQHGYGMNNWTVSKRTLEVAVRKLERQQQKTKPTLSGNCSMEWTSTN